MSAPKAKVAVLGRWLYWSRPDQLLVLSWGVVQQVVPVCAITAFITTNFPCRSWRRHWAATCHAHENVSFPRAHGRKTLPTYTRGCNYSDILLACRNPLVSDLSLYDVVGTPGVAADLAHIDTAAKVTPLFCSDAAPGTGACAGWYYILISTLCCSFEMQGADMAQAHPSN